MSWYAYRGGDADPRPVLIGRADTEHAAMQLCDDRHGGTLAWKYHPDGWWIADQDFPAVCWVVEQLADDDPWLTETAVAAVP